MESMVYARTLKKSNTKLKIFTAVITLVMIALAGYAVKASFFRPTIMVSAMKQAGKLKPGEYVSITTDRYYYMGLVDENNGKTVGYYYMLDLNDDSFVVMRSSKSLIQKDENAKKPMFTFKGVVTEDKNRAENVNAMREMGVPQDLLDSRLIAYMVTDRDADSKIWLFFILIPLALIFSGQIKGMNTNRKNRERLAKFITPEFAEQAFDGEYNMRQNYAEFGVLKMTQNWVMGIESRNTFLMPISEIVWVYKTITQHRTYGIPTSKSYDVNILFSDGIGTKVKGKEKRCDEIIASLASRNGKIIVGYSDELNILWNSNFKQFAELSKNSPQPDPEN